MYYHTQSQISSGFVDRHEYSGNYFSTVVFNTSLHTNAEMFLVGRMQ